MLTSACHVRSSDSAISSDFPSRKPQSESEADDNRPESSRQPYQQQPFSDAASTLQYRPLQDDPSQSQDLDWNQAQAYKSLPPEMSSTHRKKHHGHYARSSGVRPPHHRVSRFYSLSSICIITHKPFVSNFKEAARVLKELVNACEVMFSPTRRDAKATEDALGGQRLQTAWDLFINMPKLWNATDGKLRSPPSVPGTKAL